jgi:hypothetical protein
MFTGKSCLTAARAMRSRPGLGRIAVAPRFFCQHDADADGARRLLPFGDDLIHIRVVRVDWLDDREPIGMSTLDFYGITCVIAVHGKSGDEDRAVDTDFVHRRHHLSPVT